MRIVICALFFTLALLAQQHPNVPVQHRAMRKLEFLVGQWSGTPIVVSGPGKPLKLIQSEDVQFNLDSPLPLIEDTGHSANGQAVFHALATISHDERDRALGSDARDICWS
jgi:hypothetical protein